MAFILEYFNNICYYYNGDIMAKKKDRKDDKKKTRKYSHELYALLLIVIALIGITGGGPVGEFIKSFSVFLVGNFYAVLLLGLFLIGIYILIKREVPDFLSSRFIGIYILLISILTFAHHVYIDTLSNTLILKETLDNLMSVFSSKVIESSSGVGGGIIGGLFAFLLKTMFGVLGLKIILSTLVLVGIIMLFDISIIETFKSIITFFKKLFIRHEKIEKEKKQKEDETVYVSSADDFQVPSFNSYNEEDNLNELKRYILPPITLLDEVVKKDTESINNVKINKEKLEKVLRDFMIEGEIGEISVGPSVSQYEIRLKPGIKVSRLLNIDREIALALSARYVRIEAPIPGKDTIGIEIPNKEKSMVSFRELMEDNEIKKNKSKLLIPLGKNILNEVISFELDNMPHLLVAGTTGSGKSVCINGLITSILMRARPDEVKMIMIDPKKVELNVYKEIPHLMTPVVTDPKEAAKVLSNIVDIMVERYNIFNDTETKNITTYNEKMKRLKKQEIPYIVVIIDELADLMVVARKDVEDLILRIIQMARAAGIHLIAATQRPSTDVITGIIKANFPSRIAFAVSNSIDSRTILDTTGAEKLLGKGDMLFHPVGASHLIRIQGAFIKDKEISKIVEHVKFQQHPEYDDFLTRKKIDKKDNNYDLNEEENDDPLYNEIVEFVMASGRVSASLLQRKYRLGYNRAARIVDLLEERGIIGPHNGAKPREVLVRLKKDEQ